MPRPEAALEGEIVRRFGPAPDVEIIKCEVGSGFSRGCLPALKQALDARTFEEVSRILARHSIHWGEVGQPDLTVFVGSRGGVGELKSKDGRLSPEQIRWRDAALRKGVDWQLVRSVDEFGCWIESMRRGGEHG